MAQNGWTYYRRRSHPLETNSGFRWVYLWGRAVNTGVLGPRMMRILFGLMSLTLLSSSGFGQSAGGFKSYKNQEDYCRDNPKMPTCIKIGPVGDLTGIGIYKPPTGAPASSGSARGTAPARQR